MLLLPNAKLDVAKIVAERLRAQMAAFARRKQIDLSIRLGLGEALARGYDLADLLVKVDQTMYHSKGDGDYIGVHCLSV